MTLWPLLVVAAVGIVLAILFARGSRLFHGTRQVAVPSCWCPLRTVRFDVEFAVTAWEGIPVDVTRCSAFRPATAVSCPKACLPGSAVVGQARVAV